jgi:hypothetical protein
VLRSPIDDWHHLETDLRQRYTLAERGKVSLLTLFWEGQRMRGEPLADLSNVEFPLADSFGDKPMGREWFDIQVETVDPEKRVRGNEADSLSHPRMRGCWPAIP